MKRLGLLFLMGYSVSAGVAHAATYYVSKTGSDGNSCAQAQSTSTPRGTIGAGLGCLVAGDTLLVRAGTYAEALINNVPSGTSWTNKVRIAAYPGETVWLTQPTGDNAVYLDSGQHYIEFDGINMRGTAPGAVAVFGSTTNHIRVQNAEIVNDSSPGYSGLIVAGHIGANGGEYHEFLNLNMHGHGGPYGFYLDGNYNLIDGCDIHHVDGGGVHIYNNGGNPTGNTVRDTRIHDISTYTYFGNSNDPRRFGILIAGTSNQIYNNIIYNITGPDPLQNNAIAGYSGSGHKIYNNTVTANGGVGIGIGGSMSTTDVKNNISYGNAGGQFSDSGSGTTVSNNLFAVDPLFVNPSANNFQLQATSRAIDAAVSLSVVTTDLAGVARPQGSAPDIGSYEYRAQQAQSSAPAPPTGVRIVSN